MSRRLTFCTRRLEFDAAHRVPLHASKCRSLHGHRYAVEIRVSAPELTAEGFVMDFGAVKEVVGGWIDENLDHTVIFQEGDELLEPLAEKSKALGLRPFFRIPQPPTAEWLARIILGAASMLLARHGIRVESIVVHETPNCSAEALAP